MKVLLNRYNNPRLSEQIFVGKGDKVFAGWGAEEYGFTVGNEYEIQGVSESMYLVMKNDNGDIEEYTVEFFRRYRPLI